MKKERPLFEVYRDGERKFWTDSPECVPSPEEIAALKKAGFKAKVRKESDPK